MSNRPDEFWNYKQIEASQKNCLWQLENFQVQIGQEKTGQNEASIKKGASIGDAFQMSNLQSQMHKWQVQQNNGSNKGETDQL